LNGYNLHPKTTKWGGSTSLRKLWQRKRRKERRAQNMATKIENESIDIIIRSTTSPRTVEMTESETTIDTSDQGTPEKLKMMSTREGRNTQRPRIPTKIFQCPTTRFHSQKLPKSLAILG
jgi:hypothetical protein